jgi:hypothetical protein
MGAGEVIKDERQTFAKEMDRRLRGVSWEYASDEIVVGSYGFGAAWIKTAGGTYCITRGSHSGEWDAVLVGAAGESAGTHCPHMTHFLRTAPPEEQADE